ncbi:hypothetical protein GCM10010096_23060 [Alcaligenes pakistanensis]|uniref:Uncharacterized protein n=1 Tax=Alcaligenes pakistanensis TaxID=1482717 RepID=A0A8H9IPW2_9BURK|nr:hypothetical protein [Alcaligenes pakistanensis]GHC50488.1 hypothetical protein GCM10010096_23060 [Alcaligenes pakistanensis]
MVEIVEHPKVILTFEGQEWVAKVEVPVDSPEVVTYAFYLLRNKTRVAHSRYGKGLEVKFPNDGLAGHYQARVFIKEPATDDQPALVKTHDSERVVQLGSPYDLRRWSNRPVFERSFESPWSGHDVADGLYHFMDEGCYVDFLLGGMENLEAGSAVLVCFSGALTSRDGTSAPFFSGVEMAKRLDIPVISVSDPTLGRSHELFLGWYAGHESFTDLPNRIAILLDSFVERTSARLVLMGGSGGGFASLLILSLLQTQLASAFVWNPQTSLARYSPGPVKRFLDVAFPALSDVNDLKTALQVSGVPYSLDACAPTLVGKRHILYLQNRSDWHVKSHASPFLAKFGKGVQVSTEVFSFSTHLAYWEGDWGEGHLAPPKDIIASGLAAVIAGREPLTVALELEKELSLRR